MPKRKRDHNPAISRKSAVEAKITHTTKLVHRALKTAKGFEWQKIVKRIKLAGDADGAGKGGGGEGKRKREELEAELVALRNLDLANLAASHVHKRLLKSKKLVNEGVLPGFVTSPVNGEVLGLEEERVARANVAARLFNMKPVKETMAGFMEGIYMVAGLRWEDGIAGTKRGDDQGKQQDQKTIITQTNTHADAEETIEVESEWNGIESGSGCESGSEDLPQYDGLIAASTDEESEQNESDEIQRLSTSKTIKSRGLSVSVSGSSNSGSPPPPPPPTRTKRPPPPATKPGSMFLPTLMAGYWSGSEESATDEDAPARRKNRPGQQARRAKWEKKFGEKANHLKGQAKTRDSDWDPKRGARASDERGSRSGRGGKPGFSRGREQVTGENAIAVQPRRGRGLGQRDDTGVIHPSWEAAKRAKEMTKPSAAFQGKKVVFE